MARKRVAWREGSQELKVDMDPEAVLVGDVVLLANDATKTFYATLISDAGDEISTTLTPADRGKFRIGELPSGKWQLKLKEDGGWQRVRRATIELKPGETKLWKFEWK